jgi:hypothetical protein
LSRDNKQRGNGQRILKIPVFILNYALGAEFERLSR